MPADARGRSLRERKQQRAREAIIEAAHELFVERGFEHVTVSDIAERAEIGRSTFFRYFGDKQEVAFADRSPEAIMRAIAEEVPIVGPIGDSLPNALDNARKLVGAYVRRLAAEPEKYLQHERLVQCHQELRARGVLKQRAYADGLAEHLRRHDATPEVARLAAEIGIACYYAGRAGIGDGDPAALPDAVDAAFERLGVPRPDNQQPDTRSGAG